MSDQQKQSVAAVQEVKRPKNADKSAVQERKNLQAEPVRHVSMLDKAKYW